MWTEWYKEETLALKSSRWEFKPSSVTPWLCDLERAVVSLIYMVPGIVCSSKIISKMNVFYLGTTMSLGMQTLVNISTSLEEFQGNGLQ